MNSQNRFNYFSTGTNSIIGLVFITLFFIGLFYLAKGVFTLLSWAAPVFLILTLIINYRVVLGYVNWIWQTLKTNILRGLILVLLTIFGFPFVTAYLFLKALGLRSMAKIQNQVQDQMQDQMNSYQQGSSDARSTSSDEGFADYELLEELNESRKQKPEEMSDDNPYKSQFE